MPITRLELQKQYQQNYQAVTEHLVKDMFSRICGYISSCNNNGTTHYSKNFNYTEGWNQSLIDKVAEMLKEYYVDSKILSCNNVIYIDWSIPNTDIITTTTDHNLNVDEKDNNIQINISLPSGTRTRSSTRK
jgi:hypothetical protein